MAVETATHSSTPAPRRTDRRPGATPATAVYERPARLPRRWRNTVLSVHIAAATARLVVGAAWDIAALATSVALSVFKPGRTLGRNRITEGGTR